MANKFNIEINSEIGDLNGVILHSPGPEIENMTPENAERALYSDILNLTVASQEYAQFNNVLSELTQTFQIKELLTEVISNDKVKNDLIYKICTNENKFHIQDYLSGLENKQLSQALIEGVLKQNDSLTNFLSKKRYALRPLHNFFFTRDASVSLNNEVLINKMASRVRDREAIIMESIFNYYPLFSTKTINANDCNNCAELTIEGGDILIARNDIILIGIGARTTAPGVDFILKTLKEKKERKHIIVQELPLSPESFIHLDMVFTFLDKDKCMIYEPVILKPSRLQTVILTVDNGKVEIKEAENILVALKSLGMDLKPLYCGGSGDNWIHEREQWHSGANFFAIGPGKVIGYDRNIHTIEELNNNGFEVLKAKDILKHKINVRDYSKYVITIEGSELSRGGGGARCMTMPVNRQKVDW
ncbi:MAG: arginine deiminase [Chlorobi bacterium]|nr:arginine deiminase [Chlorobiota bacterium]